MLVDIKDIRVRLVTDWPNQVIVRLDNTPHYKFLFGIEQPYIDYLAKSNQPDHAVEKYRSLINNFDINKLGDILCIEKYGQYIISDGFHRACILLKMGYSQIEITL